MDTVSKKKRSKIMSLIKSKETNLEKSVWGILSKNGIRYRKNSSKYFGKPDIIIAPKKLAIFIDSCFWHGCKKHCRMPEANHGYWANKINNNKKRDKLVNNYYKKTAWRIIRIWEHDINKNYKKLVSKIIETINGGKT